MQDPSPSGTPFTDCTVSAMLMGVVVGGSALAAFQPWSGDSCSGAIRIHAGQDFAALAGGF
ncbi:MAG TPA: hypothetical protein VF937_05635, partial [Chloroflexota bacterium]